MPSRSVTVTGATTVSADFTPTAAGSYWVVASYSGDSNYNSTLPTACSDPLEKVVVSPKAVTLTTSTSPKTIALGQTFRDTATLAGIEPGTPPGGPTTYLHYKSDT